MVLKTKWKKKDEKNKPDIRGQDIPFCKSIRLKIHGPKRGLETSIVIFSLEMP